MKYLRRELSDGEYLFLGIGLYFMLPLFLIAIIAYSCSEPSKVRDERSWLQQCAQHRPLQACQSDYTVLQGDKR